MKGMKAERLVNMDKDTQDLVAALRDLKQKQMYICEQLASKLSPTTIEDLKIGLVRLNFAAPSGLMRYLKSK